MPVRSASVLPFPPCWSRDFTVVHPRANLRPGAGSEGDPGAAGRGGGGWSGGADPGLGAGCAPCRFKNRVGLRWEQSEPSRAAWPSRAAAPCSSPAAAAASGWGW